jgi:hypothetical protein
MAGKLFETVEIYRPYALKVQAITEGSSTVAIGLPMPVAKYES